MLPHTTFSFWHRSLIRHLARTIQIALAAGALALGCLIGIFWWMDRGSTMSREVILQAPINSHRVRMVSIAQLGGSIYFGLLTTADTGGWNLGFMSDSGWSLGIWLDRAARRAMARRVGQPRLGFDAGSVRVFNHGDEDYTLALMMPAWFVQSVLACGPLWIVLRWILQGRRSTRRGFRPTISDSCASSHS